MQKENNELVCMAQSKITVAQSNLLDEMARVNGTTRSYELRMLIQLYGTERLHLEEDRRELVEAEKAGMSLYELYKDLYPVKEVYSLPWYTGIQIMSMGFVGLLELEMLNKTVRHLLFKYTDRNLPPIRKRYPEIALILEKIVYMASNHDRQITDFCNIRDDKNGIKI